MSATDEKGYPKTKNVLAKTKTECLEKLKRLKDELGGGVKAEKIAPDMPFGEWMDHWYQYYSKPKIQGTTQSAYKTRIYNHVIPDIGHILLNKLTQNDLQQYHTRLKHTGRLVRTELYGEGLSDRMIRGIHASCRSGLQKAVEDGLIRVNPAIGCKLPPKKAREMQVLTREEMQRFLIQAKAEGYYELFLLELSTGLRRGELMALRWDDLNAKDRILSVSKQVTRIDGELMVTEPKTKNSVRRAALSQKAVDILVQEHEQHPDTPSCSRPPAPAATGARTRCPGSTGNCWQRPASRSMFAFTICAILSLLWLSPATWM